MKDEKLDARMKRYEAAYERQLVPRVPVYVRCDGRAFHTFCRGLNRPFDQDFTRTVEKVTAYMHEETNACLSFCQSDEISLAWLDPDKMPFGGRLFKIQSVLAGMASAAFCVFGSEPERGRAFRARIQGFVPHFDCRCCQMPEEELANMFVWRSQDSAKNSITLLALEYFSHGEIQGRNSADKVKMLAEKGVRWEDLDEGLRYGSFFRRELYEKVLTPEEAARIPEAERNAGPDGTVRATRSRIAKFSFGMPPADVANKADAFFRGAEPVRKEQRT